MSDRRVLLHIGLTTLVTFAFLPIDTVAQRGGGRGDAGPQATRPVGPPRFEYVGPTNAGRIAAAAAVAGKPGVYYAGAASGGVWKSTDGGGTWKPTFDDQTSQAIDALAVAPSNPNVVWAGTGEAWAVRDMDMMGDGVYKSVDAGDTWTKMGLEETGDPFPQTIRTSGTRAGGKDGSGRSRTGDWARRGGSQERPRARSPFE